MGLAGTLIAAHGLALLAILPIAVPPVFKLFFGLALATSLAFNLRRHVHPPGILELTLRADGTLEFEGRDGVRCDARVAPRTTVLPWLVVLHLEAAGKRLVLILPSDSLAGGDHRQLRLWLRWKAANR